MTDEVNHQERREARVWQPTHLVALYVAIALALAGNVALLLHSRRLATMVDDLQATSQAQMSKLNVLNEQVAMNRAASDSRADDIAREARESAVSAQDHVLREARRNQSALAAKLAETQRAHQRVAGQLDELRQAHGSTESKLNEISGDVSGVKGEVASTKSEVEGHGAELRRVTGDMGMMSGLIATNGKELAALRQLGERNYLEFDLKKKAAPKKLGGIQLSLTKADAKRSRFTLNVLADDKLVEKRDRTINEPVQLYLAGSRRPVEIVVNEVKKDEVVGYLAVPK
jgi:hypothetical protein